MQRVPAAGLGVVAEEQLHAVSRSHCETGAPGASGFTAVGNDLGNHYGVFGTGFTVAPRDGVQLFLGYDAQASRWYTLHSGMGGVQFSW